MAAVGGRSRWLKHVVGCAEYDTINLYLHNEELVDLLLTQYCSGDQIETNEMGRGEERHIQGLVWKPEEKETTWKTQA